MNKIIILFVLLFSIFIANDLDTLINRIDKLENSVDSLIHVIDKNKPHYKGTICLIIDDFGYSDNQETMDFFNLGDYITISIIPGKNYTQYLSNLSDSLDIEAIVHMPMEPHDYSKTTEEKYFLSEGMNQFEVDLIVSSAFDQIPNAIGMNNHQGSKATGSLSLMKNLARTLKDKNKLYLDSFTNPKSLAFITMRRYGVQTELRQVFLDHDEAPKVINQKIDSLINLSHTMKVAIGIGHVNQSTYDVLRVRIPEIVKEGYRFIKLSEAVK